VLEKDPDLSINTVEPKKELVVTAPVAPQMRSPVWSYLAIGTGTAGGIAGTLFAWSALSKSDQEREARFSGADPARIESLRSSAKTRAGLAYAGFGLSIAGFGVALALDLLDGGG